MKIDTLLTSRDFRRRRAAGRLALWAGGLFLLLAFGIRLVPLPRGLLQDPPPGCELVDRHGRRLRATTDFYGQYHRTISEQDLPAHLVSATLAAEDARFRSHPGIDVQAIGRAAFQWVCNRRIISGASTITQQLIKLSRHQRRTILNKGWEALQACRLEQIWGKERILAAYFDRLDYGNLNRGVREASWHYFRKAPRDLSLAEAAFLAGIPQSPTRLNPRRNFPATKARQEWILGRMEALGWISANERLDAVRETVRLVPAGREFAAPHFTDLVLARLDRLEDAPPRTSLDLALNRECERILRGHLAGLRDRNLGNGAVVVIDNRSSELLALVGSADYFAPDAGQVNGALAPRSAGSTLKPFTYLLAFEKGAAPGSVVADVPVEFPTPTGVFRPQNYGRRCHGPLRYRLALANSLNIPAVRVLDSIGGAPVLEAELQRIGFTTLNQPPDHYGLGLTIGNAEVRLLELANAYAGLARLGQWRRLKLWPGAEPAPVASEPTPERMAACWMIADILSDNAARSLEFGFDSALRFPFRAACKTGTSTDYRDNWAVGYTPEFTVAVWVGNFDGSPMQQVSGVTGAAPVMHDILQHLHDRHGTTWYAVPAGVAARVVDPHTGHQLPDPNAPGGVKEWFPSGALPPVEQPGERDAAGRILLGGEYRDWLAGAGRSRAAELALDPRATAGDLRVLSPVDGAKFFIDPDLPADGQRVALRATRECEWSSETLRCHSNGGKAMAELREGRHRLVARDPETGLETACWIDVGRW